MRALWPPINVFSGGAVRKTKRYGASRLREPEISQANFEMDVFKMFIKKAINFCICVGSAFFLASSLLSNASKIANISKTQWKVLIDKLELASGQTLSQFYDGRKYITKIISADGLSREIYRNYSDKDGIEYSFQTRWYINKEYWKEELHIGVFNETINISGSKELNGRSWTVFRFNHINDTVVLSEVEGTESVIKYIKTSGKFLPESIRFGKNLSKENLPIVSSFVIEKIIFILNNRNGDFHNTLLEYIVSSKAQAHF